jgi:EAL domain-containing protein (putative c-di-GMP-specific phosphodiesterase class I)
MGSITLPFLATLTPDFIKVDRSIIVHAVNSQSFKHFFQDLLRAVENYVQEEIIAEGIEKQEEMDIVKEMGIHLVQGYLFGKPQELTKGMIASTDLRKL